MDICFYEDVVYYQTRKTAGQKGFLAPLNDTIGRYINTCKYTYMHMWYKMMKAVGLHALANSFRLFLEVSQLHVEGKREVFAF